MLSMFFSFAFIFALYLVAIGPSNSRLSLRVERAVSVWLNLSRVGDIPVTKAEKGENVGGKESEGGVGCVREWKVVEGGSSDVAISEMAEISFTPRRVI